MTDAAQTILLVEDDANDIFMIRRAVAKSAANVRLQVVRDPVDAVMYLQGQGRYADREAFPLPMLMLLDLKLEGGSGFDILKWVRQMSGIRRLPVVVLTSSHADRDVNTAYEMGANSYLVKPLTLDNLLELVKTIEMYWLMLSQPPDLTS